MPTDCSTRPPKQSPPTERDLKIFRMAEIHGMSHENIALEPAGGISRRRVSQIVQEVRRWLATHPCEDDTLATELEQKRYARQLERMQLQNIIDRAVDGLNYAPKTLETTRTTADGSTTRTLRQQPPVDGRLLRTYLRAVMAMGKLNERTELPLPPPPPKEQEPWMHAKIQEVVNRWRLQTHNYVVSDRCLEKFAEDLTVAFLDYLEEHQPAPIANDQPVEIALDAPLASDEPTDDATSGASHVSQREAVAPAAASAAAPDASDYSVATSGETATDCAATNDSELACEKIEKGSAAAPAEEDEEYVKPLWIGPLPADHPAMRQGPPIRRRRPVPRPVTEVQIKPSEPGVQVRSGENPTPDSPPRTTRAEQTEGSKESKELAKE